MDIASEIFTDDAAHPDRGIISPVEVKNYAPNAVNLEVDAPTEGFVVLCDAYYPRWKVFVNGKEENLLRANSTVRAVPVSAGKNEIAFVYDGSSFHRAAFVSLAALLLCLSAGALGAFAHIAQRRKQGDTLSGERNRT
jgi:uncharacterized membrane protein YfhO